MPPRIAAVLETPRLRLVPVIGELLRPLRDGACSGVVVGTDPATAASPTVLATCRFGPDGQVEGEQPFAL
jgi:hypothetical protein